MHIWGALFGHLQRWPLLRGCFVHLRDLDLGSGNWPFYRCFAVKRGSTACIYDPRFTRSRGCTWVWFKIQETRGIYLLPQKTVSRTTSSYLIAMLVKRCRLCLTATLVGPMSFPNQHVFEPSYHLVIRNYYFWKFCLQLVTRISGWGCTFWH